MTKQTEALKLALEALENLFGIPDKWTSEGGGDVAVWRLGGSYRAQQAITAIKEAQKEHAMREVQRLGQEIEQEPVAPKCGAIIEVFGKDWRLEYMSLPVGKHKLYTQQYIYTASQPQMQPCAGRNCGSTNPNLHSAECFEDYEKATGMAQPEQEPVAYLCENAVGHKYFRWKKPSSTYKPIALYTTPPKRTWVGLTEQEQGAIMEDLNTHGTNLYPFAQAIEAKLKDKNT